MEFRLAFYFLQFPQNFFALDLNALDGVEKGLKYNLTHVTKLSNLYNLANMHFQTEK